MINGLKKNEGLEGMRKLDRNREVLMSSFDCAVRVGFDEIGGVGNHVVAHPLGCDILDFLDEFICYESSKMLIITPYGHLQNEDYLCKYFEFTTYKELNEKLKTLEDLLLDFDLIVCDEIKFIFDEERLDEYAHLRSTLLKKAHDKKAIYYFTSSSDKNFIFENFQNKNYMEICDLRSEDEIIRFKPKSNHLINNVRETESYFIKVREEFQKNMYCVICYCPDKSEQNELLSLAKENGFSPILIPNENLNEEQEYTKGILIKNGDAPDEYDFFIIENVEENWDFTSSFMKTAIVSTKNESEEISFLSKFNDENIDVLRKKIPGCIYIY